MIFFILTCSAIFLKRLYFDYLRTNTGVYFSTSNIHRRAAVVAATVIGSTLGHHETTTSSSLQCVNITTDVTSIIDSIENCKCIYLHPIDQLYVVSERENKNLYKIITDYLSDSLYKRVFGFDNVNYCFCSFDKRNLH